MHTSAMNFGKSFFETYCEKMLDATIVDIGAQNVNGSLRDVCPSHLNYIGVDFVAGTGVDIVIDDPYRLPFEDASLDVVVCSSCFEHSQFFWVLFVEILRTLKPTGLIYLNVPSNGSFHRYPVDCWRFYPDSGHALIAWARREGIRATLLESFIGQRSVESVSSGGAWNDFVAVFAKDELHRNHTEGRMIHSLSSYTNGYCDQNVGDQRPQFLSPDHETASNLESEIKHLNGVVHKKSILLDQSDIQIEQLTQERDRIVQSLSWRLTQPFRSTGALFRTAKRLVRAPLQAILLYGSLGTVARKAIQVFRREGLIGIRRKIVALSRLETNPKWDRTDYEKALYGEVPAHHPEFLPKVSVIVPNFNHAPYLRQRLDSIYGQTYPNFDVILLDDCSSDNSREILLEYAQRHPTNTTYVFNSENSGGVFHQWTKGFSLAKGELVWIAESDDWCEDSHLSELVRFFRNEGVKLAFCRSDFIKDNTGEKIWTSEAFLADLQFDIWKKPFIQSAHSLVNRAWGIKNIVPNVSSAIFRHPGNLPLIGKLEWQTMRLCGDWIFYLNLIRGGLVGYSPRTTNHYRQHQLGTSVNTQKSDVYYQEHEHVATTILELYKVESVTFERQRQSLFMHWCQSHESSSSDNFDILYSLDRAKANANLRQPNVLMISYALAAGGGETFPITLANLLQSRGHAVSFLNCKLMDTEPGVRAMLKRDIPLLELEALGRIGLLCKDMGIELVHSHHAWVDITLTHLLKRFPNVRKIITMHGMYELMPPNQIKELLPIIDHEIDRIVYTAAKNLTPFPKSFITQNDFTRIDNALEVTSINPIDRSTLGIAENDFVLCLVSRAIPEKGWTEAIAAVQTAQPMCGRRIHLILIGEGVEYDRLRNTHTTSSIHFLGFKPNIRDYFAMADMGFLPSRFKGESFPLVLIDCLFAGRPLLASEVGEIREMLRTETGFAGALFALDDFQIPVKDLAELVAKLAVDTRLYQEMLARVPDAAAKFDTTVMLEKYVNIYRQALGISKGTTK